MIEIDFLKQLSYTTHIRPLEVRLLANPEHVQKPWGFFVPYARGKQ